MVMPSKRSITKFISPLVCLAFSLQLVSCGTLLYPERRGQRSGQLDVAVVLLDAVGLLFFIIPGVVAFAVDVDTGAVYLPSGHRSGERRSSAAENMRIVHSAGPERLNPESLSAIICAATGRPIYLDDPNVMIEKTEKSVNIAAELTRLSRSYVRWPHDKGRRLSRRPNPVFPADPVNESRRRSMA